MALSLGNLSSAFMALRDFVRAEPVLREAQISLIREEVEREDIRRGLGLPDRPEASDESGPLAPYCWAAFGLFGDWR